MRMARHKQLNFITNVRTKDIVGRELINDDNVAIIELIKNSKDAGSPNVHIEFSEPKGGRSELTIMDAGKGMNLDDIEYKWLNLAYSEKRGKSKKSGNVYAGSKGIGRFSCDRLGEKLDLFTRQKNGEICWLHIDWTEFEIDERDTQIQSIKMDARIISDKEFKEQTERDPFRQGTLLIVSDLRARWTKAKLVSLHKELERFSIDPEKKFKVFIGAGEFPEEKKLNGQVESLIFEKLDFRTTSMHATIGKDGKEIEFELRHNGESLFKVSEVNIYSELRDITSSIFFLNRAGKSYFTKNTGYRPVNYGSIFLFLNGFRVLPYGQDGDDWLGVDRRNAQGRTRHLGTRDIVGFVRVNDKTSAFSPVTSREGLVHNEAFFQLAENVRYRINIPGRREEKDRSLLARMFRKLEHFVVRGLDWDRVESLSIDELESQSYPKRDREKLKTLETILLRESQSDDIRKVEFNLNALKKIARDEIEAYANLVETVSQKLGSKSALSMTASDKKKLSALLEHQARERERLIEERDSFKAVAEEEGMARKQAEEAKHSALQAVEVERKQRIFFQKNTSLSYDHVQNIHHQIGILAGTIFKQTNKALRDYKKHPDSDWTERLITLLEKNLMAVDKIQKASKFSTRANFNVESNETTNDLVVFIQEYVEEFVQYSGFDTHISFQNKENATFRCTFTPIEVTIMVDNIIDNSNKHGARNIVISVDQIKNGLILSFRDDGKGVSEFGAVSDVFKKGISTTNGAGIGLYHVSKILKDWRGVNAFASLINNEQLGCTLEIKMERASGE